MIDKLISKAIKAKDKVSLNAYKNVKTELQKVLTAKNAPEYSEVLLQKIIIKNIKSLEDAIVQFLEAGRDDLAASYTNELVVLKKLIPEPVDAQRLSAELRSWCIDNSYYKIIENLDCSSGPNILEIILPKKEMGKAINYLKDKFPTTNGKIISDVVKEYVEQ